MNFTPNQINIIYNALICYKDTCFVMSDKKEDLEQLLNKFADLKKTCKDG
jgi:hypothetical protein